MRPLARPVLAVAGAWPALVAAQAGADPAATGRSGWNWVVGIAALIVVIALARLIFGPPRPSGGRGA